MVDLLTFILKDHPDERPDIMDILVHRQLAKMMVTVMKEFKNVNKKSKKVTGEASAIDSSLTNMTLEEVKHHHQEEKKSTISSI